VETYVGGVESVPEPYRFDYWWFVDVLHHVAYSEQRDLLDITVERMRAGSRLVIKDIDAGSVVGCWFNRVHDALLGTGGGNERSLAEMTTMVEQAGLCILSVGRKRQIMYPHYWIAAEKQQ
jgi:hypothetical protein